MICKLPVYTCTGNDENYITVTRKHLIMLMQALRYTNAYIALYVKGGLKRFNSIIYCSKRKTQRNVRDKVGSIGIQNVPSGMQHYIQIVHNSIAFLHLPRVYIKSSCHGTNICASSNNTNINYTIHTFFILKIIRIMHDVFALMRCY